MQMTAARHPDLMDVPTVGEFAPNEANSRILALFVARQKYGRPFLAPPDMSASIVAIYREAFRALVNDAGFLREAEQAQLLIKVASGEAVTALVEEIHASPKSVIDEASKLLRR